MTYRKPGEKAADLATRIYQNDSHSEIETCMSIEAALYEVEAERDAAYGFLKRAADLFRRALLPTGTAGAWDKRVRIWLAEMVCR